MIDDGAITRWRAYLLRLGDEAFFRIVRAHLGGIETPYHKQDLIDRLERFLLRDDVQDAIVGRIDEGDARALTLVFASPCQPFTGRHRSDPQVDDSDSRLPNLAERLLVYSDRGMAINPLLLPRLLRDVINPQLLVDEAGPSTSNTIADDRPLSDALIGTALSVFAHARDLFKATGELRKKVSNQLSRIAPELLGSIPTLSPIFALAYALDRLGVVRFGGAEVMPIPDRLDAFASLPRPQRFLQLHGATRPDDHVRVLAVAEAFLRALPPDRDLSAAATVLELAKHPDIPAVEAAHLVRRLIAVGGLIEMPSGALRRADLSTVRHSPLVVQSDSTVTVPRDVDLASIIPVALAARLERSDSALTFRLDRRSVADAVRLGLEGADLISRLEEATAHGLPQNVRYSIEHWAAEAKAARYYDGPVVAVNEEIRAIVEHSDAIRREVVAQLAPGVFAMRRGSERRLDAAFQKAGLSPPLPIRPSESESETSGELDFDLPDADGSVEVGEFTLTDEQVARILQVPQIGESSRRESPMRRPAEIQRRTEELIAELNRRQYDPVVMRSLEERIRRGIIVLKEQISPEHADNESTEARGLDFLGKTRIIEQAMRGERNAVEVIVREPNGKPNRQVVIPFALERDGNDLIMDGQDQRTYEVVSVPVRRISFIRRIEGSLLG